MASFLASMRQRLEAPSHRDTTTACKTHQAKTSMTACINQETTTQIPCNRRDGAVRPTARYPEDILGSQILDFIA
jgi:hypothetical protein